ncbi:MAG: hypothetical protein KFF73_20080 [Cyclobacteriaceae bacterium]|nr:hypothetical protein [Cyclobacteriaceae bacterium]
MKTTSYNPSELEVEIAEIIEKLKDQISDGLKDRKIVAIEHDLEMDNPLLYFTIQDNDGDLHKMAMKLIQKPDEFQS